MKNNNGITLIALIVTIIVLLILSGVSISMVVGDNGILTQAGKAQTETNVAEIKEKIKMEITELQTENLGHISNSDVEAIYKKYDKDNIIKTDEDNNKYIETERGEKIIVSDIFWNDVLNSFQLPTGAKYARISLDEEGNLSNVEIMEKMPDTVQPMDIYFYGDYFYTYLPKGYYTNVDVAGWKVSINSNTSFDNLGYGKISTTDNNQTTYGEILSYINGEPVISLSGTFSRLNNLTVVPEIPNTIITMNEAFYSNNSIVDLSNLVIPGSVKDIGAAFYGCSNLVNPPILSEGLEDMGSAFEECIKLQIPTDYKIPNSVKYMSFAFCNCDSLEDLSSITIPKNVENMSHTFSGCENLVNLPDFSKAINLVNIDSLFYGCSLLEEIPNLNSNKIITMNWTFYECVSMKDVSDFKISKNVQEMRRCFEGCASLTTPPDFSEAINLQDVEEIFRLCTSLDTLPDFSNCISLKIMSNSFVLCTSLPTDLSLFVIPESVTDIYQTFYGCTSIVTSPIIPKNVYRAHGTFKGCTNLTGTLIVNGNPNFYDEFIYNTQISEISGDTTMASTLMRTKN